ncbi:hypothetical protein P3L10_003342 [Capsicum annuum]
MRTNNRIAKSPEGTNVSKGQLTAEGEENAQVNQSSIASTQRLAESSLLDARASEAHELNLFRDYAASTAERDGGIFPTSSSHRSCVPP